MTKQAVSVGKRLASCEPVTRLHNRTNLDGAVVATVLVELAKASLILLPVIAGGYLIAWVFLAVKVKG